MSLRKKSNIDELNGLLDQGTSLTGELTFSGTLRIDGNVHGSISTSDTLVVGESASVHADIKAGDVQIYGTVFGNVEGTRRIEIFSTGRLNGDIRTAQFVIEEGGTFEGRSRGSTESESSEEEAGAEFSAGASQLGSNSSYGGEPSADVVPPAERKQEGEWPDRFKP